MRKLKFRTDDKELVISCHSGINTIHPILRMTPCSPFFTLMPPLSPSLTCHYQSHFTLQSRLLRWLLGCVWGLWPGGRLATGHSLSLSGPREMAGPHGQTDILIPGPWLRAVQCEIWNFLDPESWMIKNGSLSRVYVVLLWLDLRYDKLGCV